MESNTLEMIMARSGEDEERAAHIIESQRKTRTGKLIK